MYSWKIFILIPLIASILCSCSDEQPLSYKLERPAKPEKIPSEFIEYKEQIERSKINYVRVTPSPSAELKVKQSKFRGIPFLPQGHEYPVSRKGEKLELLAQINFKEVPNLHNYPESGILQIFINPAMSDEHVWGMAMYRGNPWSDEDYFSSLQKQDNFKLVYYPEHLVNGPADTKKYVPYQGYGMPISGPMRLQFELDSEYVNTEDYQFEEYVGLSIPKFYEKHQDTPWESMDALYQYLMSDAVAKIGGYGRFVQNDPRSIEKRDEDWIVLLNINSAAVGEEDILWGDAGVATFLIKKRDLERLDFSKVAYYWDNH